MTGLLFHLAVPEEWASAQPSGCYERSTRGRSLDEEGFVHCSFAHQVAATANRFYADLAGLVVLTIDPDRLAAPVVVEPGAPGGEEFPHVYGPIPIDAVVAVTPWERGPDGTFADPPIDLRRS